MSLYRVVCLVLAASSVMALPPTVNDDQEGPYQQSERASNKGQAADTAAGMLLAKSISDTAETASKELKKLLSELDVAESRQQALIERHRRATQHGNYQHPELRRLGRPLRQGQERIRALRTKASEIRGVVTTLTALDASFSAVSATENIVEGTRFLKAASTLGSLGGSSREEARAYQQTVDQVLAENALYSPESFMVRLAGDCSPGTAAWLSCAGLAFNNFARLVANLAVQEAAIQQMLDSSSEIIASRIQSYAELGAQHARDGRVSGFDNLDRPAILDVEVLARSADNVISLLDNRSFWVKLVRRSRHKALREGAEALKRDLGKGKQSSVMAQFRSAYQAAHDSARIEMEIQQIDEQIDRLLSEIDKLTSLMDRMAEEMRQLMKVLETAEEAEQSEEPESGEPGELSCEEELEENYAPYAQDITACDSPGEEEADEEKSSAADESSGRAAESDFCRALDSPLPEGLSNTEYCGVLTPQPGVQQFQSACEGAEKLQTHTCTVVYCNHVFYRWGAPDIIDCVEKIAAQKDRQTR